MAVKKTIDTWKLKHWYNVVAPKFLGEVHTTLVVPASDESLLENRAISIPLKEITRDLNHIYTTVKLRVSEVKSKSAFTKFIGHSVAREYVLTLVRRRRDALEVHLPLVSKDGIEFQLSALVVTSNTCSGKQKKALRNNLSALLKEKSSAMDFGDFVRAVLFQQLSGELHAKLQKIYPVRRVEITKTELYEEFDVPQPMQLGEKEEKQKAEEKIEEPAAA